MARIAGVTLHKKRIEVALTYIFGIGQSLTSKILAEVGIDRNVRTNDLSEDQVNRLRETIEKNYRVEGELRREVSSNIKRLRDIGSWRGTRHAKRLPIHGRSKTNSRTVRGNVRRTMGSGRKTPAQKT